MTSRTPAPTPRQLEVLRTLAGLDSGIPCSNRELAAALGIGRGAAQNHLAKLERKGLIAATKGASRSRRITPLGERTLDQLGGQNPKEQPPRFAFLEMVPCDICGAKRAGEGSCPLCARRKPTTREQARSRRTRLVRSRTEKLNRLPLYQRGNTPEHWRPKTRGECLLVPRPCPFVGCRWNLYCDVLPTTGNLKLNFPDLEPGELVESCALDVAERGGVTLEAMGPMLNVGRERLRQIVDGAKHKLEVSLAELA